MTRTIRKTSIRFLVVGMALVAMLSMSTAVLAFNPQPEPPGAHMPAAQDDLMTLLFPTDSAGPIGAAAAGIAGRGVTPGR
jgi:hypothetical protein